MDIQQNIQMRPLGDSAIVVQIGEGISRKFIMSLFM